MEILLYFGTAMFVLWMIRKMGKPI